MLRIAMDYAGEERLGNELLATIDNHKPLPTLKRLQERYLGARPVPCLPAGRPLSQARQQDLASYDQLLQGQWYHTETSHA